MTGHQSSARILYPAAAYFGLVFAVGFVLGTVRVLVLAPSVGERAAELLETPFMVLASYLAARWTVRRFRVPASGGARLAVGLGALALLLGAEVAVVLYVQGVSLREYVANRDPVSGTVYLGALALFALMPALVGPGRETARTGSVSSA